MTGIVIATPSEYSPTIALLPSFAKTANVKKFEPAYTTFPKKVQEMFLLSDNPFTGEAPEDEGKLGGTVSIG